MNLPNLLTLIRILLTPFLVILLIRGRTFDSLLIFTAAGVTDGLDGLLARLLRQKTRLGAILDPIADKMLLASAYVTLAITGSLPAWLSVTVISRDVIILLGIMILFFMQVSIEIRPTILSKITTVSQLGTVFVVLLNHDFEWLARIIPTLYTATALFTVASGLHYMARGIRMLGFEEEKTH